MESGQSEVFETTAESANRITVVLGRDSVISSALQGQDVLKADIGERFRAVNVYSLSPGLEKLAACMALPLDDPGHGVLTPPPVPGNAPAQQQQSSLVRVPATAPDSAVPVPPAQPVAQPVQRQSGDSMTSRIASLMADTEPAPPPSSDLLAPAPSPLDGQNGGDPFNSRIHDMVKELSGVAPPPPPQPLLQPQPEPQQFQQPVQAQPIPQPQPVPVQTAQAPAPVESAPLQPMAQKPVQKPVEPPPSVAAPAQQPAPPSPAVAVAPEPEIQVPAPVAAPEQLAVVEEPQPEEPPREITWAHKRLVPNAPDFITDRMAEKAREAQPGVMLAETRDAVHKPLSMPPELRKKPEEPEAPAPTQGASMDQPMMQPPGPQPAIPELIPQTGRLPSLDSEIALTSEPPLGSEEPMFETADAGTGEMTMEDILKEPLTPQERSDAEPVVEENLPGITKPTTPSDFVQEMQNDQTLLAQAEKIDQTTLTAENTDMEMVSSLLEKMRLLEIEKESLRKELASYQSGPVSDIARIESQARKIYALKTRLERLGDMNAQLQTELKFNKDKVRDLEQLMIELQAQADEAEALRERVTSLSEQNDALRVQVTDLDKEAKEARLLREEDRRRLDELRDIIGSMSSKLDGLSGSGLFGDDGLGGAQDDAGENNGEESTTPMLPEPTPENNTTVPEIQSVDPSEFEGLINP